jgi:hypothetical protein
MFQAIDLTGFRRENEPSAAALARFVDVLPSKYEYFTTTLL